MHICQLLYVQQRILECEDKRGNHTVAFRMWRNQTGIFWWRILEIDGTHTVGKQQAPFSRCPLSGYCWNMTRVFMQVSLLHQLAPIQFRIWSISWAKSQQISFGSKWYRLLLYHRKVLHLHLQVNVIFVSALTSSFCVWFMVLFCFESTVVSVGISSAATSQNCGAQSLRRIQVHCYLLNLLTNMCPN